MNGANDMSPEEAWARYENVDSQHERVCCVSPTTIDLTGTTDTSGSIEPIVVDETNASAETTNVDAGDDERPIVVDEAVERLFVG